MFIRKTHRAGSRGEGKDLRSDGMEGTGGTGGTEVGCRGAEGSEQLTDDLDCLGAETSRKRTRTA